MNTNAAAVSGRMSSVLEVFDDEDYGGFEEEDDEFDDAKAEKDAPSAMDESNQKVKKLPQLPDMFAMVYKRSTDLYLEKDYHGALQIFKDIAKSVKNYAPLHDIMADCYQNLGKPHEALSCCKAAVKLHPRYIEAWNRYAEVADILEDDEEQIHALKHIIKMNVGNLANVAVELRRLLSLLDPSEAFLVNKYRSRLFLAELWSGLQPDYSLAVNVMQWLYAEKRPQDVLIFLEKFVPQRIPNNDLPESVLTVFVEVLLQTKQSERAAQFLIELGVILLDVRDASGTFSLTDFPSATVKDGSSAALIAAACIVMLDFGISSNIEQLLQKGILGAINLGKSKIYLHLANVLLGKDMVMHARSLMERLQLHPEFQSPEFYYQLGLIFERLNDIKQALHAYNRAVSLKPSFRTARFRILKLGLPVPSSKNIGTVEGRQRTILLQKRIFENYMEQKLRDDKMEMLRCSVDLVTSTFAHLDEIVPERIIDKLEGSPFRVEQNLKDYLLYAPAIATEDVPLEDFWDICVEGCRIALDSRQYEEFLVITFHALCTADFRPFPEKVDIMKLGIITGLYYLKKNLRFAVGYFRDQLISKKQADYSVPVWNLFYLLVSQVKHTIPLMKWATRWCKNYGYSKEITMFIANDSLRRGQSRHALDLYSMIAKNEGINDASWQVLLNLGLLYVRISAQFHLTKRSQIYSLGMMFMEKYALRRGLCPEVMYNKGRAGHLYGDLASAIVYYKECLRLSQISSSTASKEERLYFDCAFEAAYNLRAIYVRLKQPVQVADLYTDKLHWKNIRGLSTAVNFNRQINL
ncbi:uncharacterized protein LOC129584929 [Paramacrobiotus metropolitanus]|uniref:uncharacterized protein LOC129584929 n=1 Tax=Paramacrobiotus metropolitanus TaxID=2943436 RepID=UPI002445772A|nr:uncharacterized protein LOC129584929 [Paramacrobiotus metropolitanus]XP_055333338.1 uncharacterized protein LOC129584929 [Paramacrobiotus metropolitanus]